MTDFVGRRKHIKRRFQRQNPHHEFAWLGGRLYDVTSATFPVEVEGAPHVPKIDGRGLARQAEGLAAAHPPAALLASRASRRIRGGSSPSWW